MIAGALKEIPQNLGQKFTQSGGIPGNKLETVDDFVRLMGSIGLGQGNPLPLSGLPRESVQDTPLSGGIKNFLEAGGLQPGGIPGKLEGLFVDQFNDQLRRGISGDEAPKQETPALDVQFKKPAKRKRASKSTTEFKPKIAQPEEAVVEPRKLDRRDTGEKVSERTFNAIINEVEFKNATRKDKVKFLKSKGISMEQFKDAL